MRHIKHTDRYCHIGISAGLAAINPVAAAGTAGLAAADYFSAKSLQNDAQSFTKSQWRNKHQWEVSDLKAAGLNPILSAHSGTSPSSSGIASASPGRTAVASKQANTAKALQSSQSQLMTAQANAQQSMDGFYQSQTNLKNMELRILESQLPHATLTKNFWESKEGRAAFYADQILPRAHSAKDLLNPLSFIFGKGKTTKTEKGTRFPYRYNSTNPNPANRGY